MRRILEKGPLMVGQLDYLGEFYYHVDVCWSWTAWPATDDITFYSAFKHVYETAVDGIAWYSSSTPNPFPALKGYENVNQKLA
jgi:hypothetical protein